MESSALLPYFIMHVTLCSNCLISQLMPKAQNLDSGNETTILCKIFLEKLRNQSKLDTAEKPLMSFLPVL